MGKYTVYVHINKTNGKKYVGLTSTPVKRRWDNGLGYMEGTFFRSAIDKYGFDGFEHIIIAENLTHDEACKLEQEYILKWKTTDREYGYNQTLGGEGYLIHGGSGTHLYHVWTTTIATNPCEEWRNFVPFRDWAEANGYSEELFISRIDTTKEFSADNCEWVDRAIALGRRNNNRKIEFNGEVHTLNEWARITGINKQTLQMRLDKGGWSIERALTTSTEKKPYEKSNSTGLPHHIYRKRNKYEVCVQKNGKRYRRVCATIDEAIKERDRMLAQYESL